MTDPQDMDRATLEREVSRLRKFQDAYHEHSVEGEKDLRATIATLTEALDPLGTMFSGKGGSPEASWYEETIFNETRLYESLGKEDARTVLYIWDRYRKAVEALPECASHAL